MWVSDVTPLLRSLPLLQNPARVGHICFWNRLENVFSAGGVGQNHKAPKIAFDQLFGEFVTVQS